METIVLEAVIRIRYSKPVEVLLMLVHYRRILHKGVVMRCSVLLAAVPQTSIVIPTLPVRFNGHMYCVSVVVQCRVRFHL